MSRLVNAFAGKSGNKINDLVKTVTNKYNITDDYLVRDSVVSFYEQIFKKLYTTNRLDENITFDEFVELSKDIKFSKLTDDKINKNLIDDCLFLLYEIIEPVIELSRVYLVSEYTKQTLYYSNGKDKNRTILYVTPRKHEAIQVRKELANAIISGGDYEFPESDYSPKSIFVRINGKHNTGVYMLNDTDDFYKFLPYVAENYCNTWLELDDGTDSLSTEDDEFLKVYNQLKSIGDTIPESFEKRYKVLQKKISTHKIQAAEHNEYITVYKSVMDGKKDYSESALMNAISYICGYESEILDIQNVKEL